MIIKTNPGIIQLKAMFIFYIQVYDGKVPSNSNYLNKCFNINLFMSIVFLLTIVEG